MQERRAFPKLLWGGLVVVVVVVIVVENGFNIVCKIVMFVLLQYDAQYYYSPAPEYDMRSGVR